MNLSYEIVEHIGVLARNPIDWTKEANLVSWRGRYKEPLVDIREWSPDKKRMGRGITLTKEEALHLAVMLLERLSDAGESV